MSKHWFYEWILPLSPTILTIIGWWVIGKREQDKRKNDRFHQRIDTAILLIAEIKKLAIEYYGKNGSECTEIGQEIVFKFKKLSYLCGKISQDSVIQNCFLAFKIEISGGDFQNYHRSALPNKHQKFLDIRDKAFELRKMLDDLHDSVN